MEDSIEYSDVVQENRSSMHPGRLKLQTSSVIFKNIKTGRQDVFQAGDLHNASWLHRARGHCLKLSLHNGTIHRFDGIKEAEFDRLSTFIEKNYSITLKKLDLSYKGWNWGQCEFVDNGLDFKIGEKLVFEVPLSNVSHSAVGKNECALEFHQNEEATVSLVEMRFHIPTKKEKELTIEPVGSGDEEPEQEDPVEEFCKKVLDKADIIKIEGNAIAIFQEITCLTPRGRYDIKIYPTFLQLHGKTFDYKIPFTTILRLFLLPHKDGRQMFFMVSVDPPIRQGMTRYPFLVMVFNKDDETTLELSLTEEEIAEKYEGKLEKEMSGLEYEVVSRIMKSFVNRKITVPGTFVGSQGTQCVSCSYKAGTGFLYPLERGFIFAHKPPMHIRFDEISAVNFARSSGNTRSFDFEVETKVGTMFTFVGVEKGEYGKLYDFVTEKKLRVRNIGGMGGQPNYKENLGDSSDEGGHDAYLHKMKAQGKDRRESEDDSTDEDFVPEGLDGDEVAEEFDTDYYSDSDDAYKPGASDDSEADEKRAMKREAAKARKEKRKREGGEPGGRKKKKKDPNAPKGAQTGYFLFLSEVRAEIKEETPDISVTELTKKAGEKWRGLTDAEKEPYQELAKKDRERWEREIAEYRELHKDDPVSSDEDESKGSAPKKPKMKKKKTSPSKKGDETGRAMTGASFKSKEFIDADDSSSSGDESDDDKPEKKNDVKSGSDEKEESEKEESEKEESEKEDVAGDE